MDFARAVNPSKCNDWYDNWWHNIADINNLKSLHLPGFDLNVNNVSQIASAIQINKSLVSLYISKSYINDIGMAKLCAALCSNETLKLLDVSDNQLQCTTNIAQVLERNHTLTCLALGSNKIGNEGCHHLAKALTKNKTLTSLYVRDNMISDDGAKELAKSFTKNTTLLQMDLSFNNIENEGAKALVNTLQCCGGLKVLFVVFNFISIDECLSPVTIAHKFLAYTADVWNTIPVYSAEVVTGKHVFFTKQRYYGEWKEGKLCKIILQDVYNHVIPDHQLNCLKYYLKEEFGRYDADA